VVSKQVGSINQTRGFTGHEFDPETGFHYYGGRYYDQDISRFVSPDPYVQEPNNPQNLNRYSYVLNNPQSLVDLSGHFWWFIPAIITSFITSAEIIFSGAIIADAVIVGVETGAALAGIASAVASNAYLTSRLQSEILKANHNKHGTSNSQTGNNVQQSRPGPNRRSARGVES
jgi:RHS repeat-associated protein